MLLWIVPGLLVIWAVQRKERVEIVRSTNVADDFKNQADDLLSCLRTENPDNSLDKFWVDKYRNETDDEIIFRLRSAAEQLGRFPYKVEVCGSSYLKSRFGNWIKLLNRTEISKN